MTNPVHAKLAALAADIHGRAPTTTLTHDGRTYVLELLKPEWDEWALANVLGSTASAILMNVRLPIIAAALRSIDGVPVEELIPTDPDLPKDVASSHRVMTEWRKRQLLTWLRANVDSLWVEALYTAYDDMRRSYTANVSKMLTKQEGDANLA